MVSWTWFESFRSRPRVYGLESFQVLENRTLLASDFSSLLASSPSENFAAIVAVGSAGDQNLDPAGTPSGKPVFDSNGITVPDIVQVGQLNVPISVVVSDAPQGTRLDAWIDWNGDGNFGGAAEHVATGFSVEDGTNTLKVDVPSWVPPGVILGRFQLSVSGGVGVEGSTATRETRNCPLTVVPPNYPSGQFGPANPINSTALGAFTIDAADMDGDGDLDLLSASYNDNTIAWYENDGHQNFTKHIISAMVTKATYVIAADINGDGYMDVVASSLGDNAVTWYQNDGHQNFTLHVVTTSAMAIDGFFVADVDGDGDPDIVSASKADSTVAWYENQGSPGFAKHVISTTANLACSVFAADMNGDGFLDIVSASFYDDTIAWYENDGHQGFTRHIISTTANGARYVFVADVDGDGHQDVVTSSFYDNTIAWYQNDGHGGFVKNIITSTATNAVAVFVADMDGDGDLDVLATSRGSNTVAWYENTGGQFWPQHTISTKDIGAHGVIAADVNGDGRLDVVTASQFGNRIAWYQNVANPFPLTVVLASASPAVTNQNPIPVTVNFNEPVSDFTAQSLIVQNGSVSNFTGSGSSYSFDLIPTSESTVTVSLPAGAVTDGAGYGNTAVLLTREFDLIPPVTSLNGGTATYIRNGTPVNVMPDLTVEGSRVGGGTLAVVMNSSKTSKLLTYVFDNQPLNALGTLVTTRNAGRQVSIVTLSSGTTADQIQAALRTLTFSVSKYRVNFSAQLKIQLTDNVGQAGTAVNQTVDVRRMPIVAKHPRHLGLA
ncbi:MAG: hypothetical protein JWM11_3079 [Planctomycetaceae bacterium]|nr:hypothetical protein [Planctomycetaceae bacterium]